MKRIIPLSVAIASLLSAGWASAESRSWSSAANAEQKLTGELQAVNGDQITVQFEGREPAQFDIAFFSDADRAYVESVREKFMTAPTAPTAPAGAAAAAGGIYRDTAANLAGGGVRPSKYYILYFAAST